MAKYQGTPEFSHAQPPSTGVLLVNLGTPEAPTPDAVRRFLAEFLWDPRVVEMARPLWWLILHGVILRLRPSRVARAYQTVWTEDGSPLLAISKQQLQAVREALAQQTDSRVEVALGMRYGTPSIEAAMQELLAAFDRLVQRKLQQRMKILVLIVHSALPEYGRPPTPNAEASTRSSHPGTLDEEECLLVPIVVADKTTATPQEIVN